MNISLPLRMKQDIRQCEMFQRLQLSTMRAFPDIPATRRDRSFFNSFPSRRNNHGRVHKSSLGAALQLAVYHRFLIKVFRRVLSLTFRRWPVS
ncbi:hypothetical protein NPIL_540141 [Nephila pilipes]|uniref:Uncharacterized protein n=1 Tax=Nephila pilipes TaxID=299642 RepID=A0A8X6N3V9_NEPPI|nr:hypothetical protein NPIL_540141 [Nephila pilipes]